MSTIQFNQLNRYTNSLQRQKSTNAGQRPLDFKSGKPQLTGLVPAQLGQEKGPLNALKVVNKTHAQRKIEPLSPPNEGKVSSKTWIRSAVICTALVIVGLAAALWNPQASTEKVTNSLTMSGLSKDGAADCANFPRLCEKYGLGNQAVTESGISNVTGEIESSPFFNIEQGSISPNIDLLSILKNRELSLQPENQFLNHVEYHQAQVENFVNEPPSSQPSVFEGLEKLHDVSQDVQSQKFEDASLIDAEEEKGGVSSENGAKVEVSSTGETTKDIFLISKGNFKINSSQEQESDVKSFNASQDKMLWSDTMMSVLDSVTSGLYAVQQFYSKNKSLIIAISASIVVIGLQLIQRRRVNLIRNIVGGAVVNHFGGGNEGAIRPNPHGSLEKIHQLPKPPVDTKQYAKMQDDIPYCSLHRVNLGKKDQDPIDGDDLPIPPQFLVDAGIEGYWHFGSLMLQMLAQSAPQDMQRNSQVTVLRDFASRMNIPPEQIFSLWRKPGEEVGRLPQPDDLEDMAYDVRQEAAALLMTDYRFLGFYYLLQDAANNNVLAAELLQFFQDTHPGIWTPKTWKKEFPTFPFAPKPAIPSGALKKLYPKPLQW